MPTPSQPHRDPRSILITGCSSGIGYCLAEGLHRRGYRVFASGRRLADLGPLASLGIQVLALDLRDSTSIDQAVNQVLDQTQGNIYGLINNGAYGQPGAVEDLSRAVLREQFETNVFGTHELTARILPAMRAAGEGRIVQISSILGLVCMSYRGAYNASKYALEALSDSLRLELRGTGVQVVLIEPGPVHSRFRVNAYAAFKARIDRQNSPHRKVYEQVESRLDSLDEVPFTLPAQAVLKKVRLALERPRPRPRYLVTKPAWLLARLKRLLPDRWMDALLSRAGEHP